MGECRGARRRDGARSCARSRPGPARRRARRCVPATSAASPTASRGSSTRRGRRLGASSRWQRANQAEIAAHASTRTRRGARATQPLADQNAGSVFRNPPDDHAGRLIEAAGPEGPAARQRAGQRAPRQLHRHRPRRARGRRPRARRSRARDRGRSVRASSCSTRSSSSATWPDAGSCMTGGCGSASSPAAARPSTR